MHGANTKINLYMFKSIMKDKTFCVLLARTPWI